MKYTSMLNSGGMLCIDDYLGVPEVQIPVDMFLKKNPAYRKIAIEGRTLFVKKHSSAKNKLVILETLVIPFVNLFFQWRKSYLKRVSN